MKVKRFLGFGLSLIMMISNLNVSFGGSPVEAVDDVLEESAAEDILMSRQAADVGGISLYSASSTDYKYEVEGGYIYFDESTGSITDCDESVTAAVIPSEINGVKVTDIRSFAFDKCSNLTRITISEGISSIGLHAFYKCSSLTSVIIPEGITRIGGSAFYGCSSLTNITVPESVMIIEPYAFVSCNNLKSISIIGKGTYIGNDVFNFCDNLTIYCYSGSYAETYAIENDIPYIILGTEGSDDSLIKISSTKTFPIDDNNYIEATVTPSMGDNGSAVWTSSNTDVVEIGESSIATAYGSDTLFCTLNCKAEGTSIITVTTADGASASCLVTVKGKELEVTSINVNGQGKILEEYKPIELNVVIEFNEKIKVSESIDNYYPKANIYTYINGEKAMICEEYPVEQIDENSIIISSLNGLITLPRGKIYVEILEDSIKPVDEAVKYDPEILSNLSFENTSSFILGYDSFSFFNSKSSFEEDKYSLSEAAARKALEMGVSKNKINKYKKMDWGGVCYGISSFVAMAKRGTIDYTKYEQELSEYVNYLQGSVANSKIPKNDTGEGGLRDTLNCLHIIQEIDGMRNRTNIIFYDEDEIANKLEELVSVVNSDLPVSVDIVYREKDDNTFILARKKYFHTILPFKVETNNMGYRVLCYDSNSASNSETIMEFDRNYKNLKVYQTDETYNKYGEIRAIGINYISQIESLYGNGIMTLSTYAENDRGEDTTLISVVMDDNFEISDGENTIYYNNGEFSGAVDLVISSKVHGGGADSAAEIELELPKGNYSVKSENGSLECTFDNGEMFSYIKTSDRAEILFNDANKINISGENIESSVLLSLDGDGSDSIILDIPASNKTEISGVDTNTINVSTDSAENIHAVNLTDCIETDEKEIESNAVISYDSDGIATNYSLVYGDVDCDGELTVNDVAVVLDKVLNDSFKMPVEDKENNWMEYADVDSDNRLTSGDAAYILQRVLDSSFKFPVEK